VPRQREGVAAQVCPRQIGAGPRLIRPAAFDGALGLSSARVGAWAPGMRARLPQFGS
jgi:hypothetical protein